MGSRLVHWISGKITTERNQVFFWLACWILADFLPPYTKCRGKHVLLICGLNIGSDYYITVCMQPLAMQILRILFDPGYSAGPSEIAVMDFLAGSSSANRTDDTLFHVDSLILANIRSRYLVCCSRGGNVNGGFLQL